MPRKWKLKAGLQRFCAAAPMGHHLYRFLQSTVGGLRDQSPQAYADACTQIIGAVGGIRSMPGLSSVEVGTGWNVSLPLALHLCGADSCATFDVTRHCRPHASLRAARALVPTLRGAFSGDDDIPALIDDRWRRLADCDWWQLLEAAHITYRAPADAARTELRSGSQDLVFSRATLQHIPPTALAAILQEAARVLRPGGSMWHRLGLTDQFSLFDRRLSRIHYLSYSEEDWRKVAGNRYAYTNRLRVSDFVRLARDAGFDVEVRNARIDQEAIAFARAGRVHRDFADRSDSDLGTVAADLLCRKP